MPVQNELPFVICPAVQILCNQRGDTVLKNKEKILYTCKHRRALVYTIQKLVMDEAVRKLLLEQVKYHDLDKSLLLLLVDAEVASKYHKAHAKHHMENDIPKSRYDKIEAVLDYESAGYTKPDKPLNAYDTIQKRKPELAGVLIPILNEFDIAKSYKNTPNDTDWLAFNQSFPEITEQYALAEIISYILDEITKEQVREAFGYAVKTAGIDLRQTQEIDLQRLHAF